MNIENEKIYWCIDKLLSYSQAILYLVIGERGVGKTFSTKDYVLNHYKKKKKKFVWIRRYGSDLDSAIGTKTNVEWAKSIKIKHPGNYSIIESEKIKYIHKDDKLIGYGMSLKMAESIKGSEFNDVDTIVFDEFLVGDGGSKYLKNEPMYLLSLIESIGRLRPIKIILLGNATSTINPYFDFFKIGLPQNVEYQTFKNGTIVVNYIKNEKYREVKKQSKFGKLVSGTAYEKYAIDNQFINDSYNFIRKKDNRAQLFFNIILNQKNYGIWIYKDNMYISEKCNLNNNIILTFDYENHNDKTLLVKGNSPFMKNVINHYNIGKLFFENLKIKTLFLDLLKRSRLIW